MLYKRLSPLHLCVCVPEWYIHVYIYIYMYIYICIIYIYQYILYIIGDHYPSSHWFSNKQHYLSINIYYISFLDIGHGISFCWRLDMLTFLKPWHTNSPFWKSNMSNSRLTKKTWSLSLKINIQFTFLKTQHTKSGTIGHGNSLFPLCPRPQRGSWLSSGFPEDFVID